MKKPKQSPLNLTDEEVLKEFVNRFKCDGAVLIYYDEEGGHGFTRWINKKGKQDCKKIMDALEFIENKKL